MTKFCHCFRNSAGTEQNVEKGNRCEYFPAAEYIVERTYRPPQPSTLTITHTYENSKCWINLRCVFLGMWEESHRPGENPRHHGENITNFTKEGRGLDLNPGTSAPSGGRANQSTIDVF